MRRFSEIYLQLELSTQAHRKVAILRDYFTGIDPRDGAWAIYLLTRRKLRRLATTRQLREWCCRAADIADWLFDESYAAVGDVAETAALLVPNPLPSNSISLHEVAERLMTGSNIKDMTKREALLVQTWWQLGHDERFVVNKLATGGLRSAVTENTVVRSLAQCSRLPEAVIAHRLQGEWEPTARFYEGLLSDECSSSKLARPYPFCRAVPFPDSDGVRGAVSDWQVEWHWDGLRAQLIRRNGESFLWSQKEEPILASFPELAEAAAALPNGCVIDGEIIACKEGHVLPRTKLERRIGRKNFGRKLMTEVPVMFVAFDLLEAGGVDLRDRPLSERRQRLEALLNDVDRPHWFSPGGRGHPSSPDEFVREDARLALSPLVPVGSWTECNHLRDAARQCRAQGLILKRIDSNYLANGNARPWRTLRASPHSVRAVLLYVQWGPGRDDVEYTFALWKDGELVPVGKVRPELRSGERDLVHAFAAANTLERFGPVRRVNPELVFELAFDTVEPSRRHKCGFVMRSPRLVGLCQEISFAGADSLDSLHRLLAGGS